MAGFCLDSSAWVDVDNFGSLVAPAFGDGQALFSAFNASLGTKGGWEAAIGGFGLGFSGIEATLAFLSSAPWPSEPVTSVSGVLELDLVSSVISTRQVDQASVTLFEPLGSGVSVDETDGATFDLLFSNNNSSAHTVLLPFTVSFTGLGVTTPLDTIKFRLVGSTGELGFSSVKIYDLCINEGSVFEFFWTDRTNTTERPL